MPSFLNATIRFTFFTMAKQSKQLGAYKLARYAYDKLQVRMECRISGRFSCELPEGGIKRFVSDRDGLSKVLDSVTMVLVLLYFAM